MLGNSKSPVSFGSSCNNPKQTGLLPDGSSFPGNPNSQGFLTALSRNVFRCSSTPEITSTSASYGGVVDASYGGGTDTTYKFHYNQGIGNGAEGGDPGNSHPHGSSNDELGQTPGCNMKLFF
ncbi:MAG TPA: hypothetical protein V6C78_08930 [Crinalium sp.]|jgi:hypothetical protein